MLGKQTVTTIPGSAFFDSAIDFGMIRAGKVDLTVLGAMEVSEREILLTGRYPAKCKGNGAEHGSRRQCKEYYRGNDAHQSERRIEILSRCTLPLTGIRCVKKIVTDLAVVEVTETGFKLLERAPGNFCR
jgi:3-oxoacid CoA-transferase subunit B